MQKSHILQALETFVRQRPGLEFANYGDVSAYRSEMRGITRNRNHALVLLHELAMRDSITADHIMQASKQAFSGRLSIVCDGDKVRIDYCTGQYFPTEYRAAVCAVLSSVLWAYFRECGYSDGDAIRKHAVRSFGVSIARAWFR